MLCPRRRTPPPPPPPSADTELSQPVVEASQLMIFAGGVAVPDGPEAAAADAAAAALLTAVKVPGAFSGASFVGPTRDGRRELHFALCAGQQVSRGWTGGCFVALLISKKHTIACAAICCTTFLPRLVSLAKCCALCALCTGVFLSYQKTALPWVRRLVARAVCARATHSPRSFLACLMTGLKPLWPSAPWCGG
jgi:hypothetical protein